MDVSQTLARYIASEVLRQPDRVIKPTDKLISGGMIGSFDLVDIQAFIETEFGVWIEDAAMTVKNCDTLAQLIALIDERKGRE